jgi:hypothetical protein
MASLAEGRAVARCVAEEALSNLGRPFPLGKREGELANGGSMLHTP